jgi:hypothetical protein
MLPPDLGMLQGVCFGESATMVGSIGIVTIRISLDFGKVVGSCRKGMIELLLLPACVVGGHLFEASKVFVAGEPHDQ